MTGTERRQLAMLVDKARRERICWDIRVNKHEFPALCANGSLWDTTRPHQPCLSCGSPCRGQICYECKSRAKKGECAVCSVPVANQKYLCSEHISRCMDCGKPNSPNRDRCRACAYTALRSPDRTCVECGKTPIGRKSTRCIKCHTKYMRTCQFDSVRVLAVKHAKEKALA